MWKVPTEIEKIASENRKYIKDLEDVAVAARELINALDDERISDMTHLYEELDEKLWKVEKK